MRRACCLIMWISPRARGAAGLYRLRDTHKEFDAARRDGRIGIPCFVRDDGTVIVGAQTLLDAARA